MQKQASKTLTEMVIKYKQTRDPDLYKQIFKESKKYAQKHLFKIYTNAVDKDYVDGLVHGLIHLAIKTYNPEEATKFETHLHNYLKKVYSETETAGYSIEVSRSKLQKVKKLRQAIDDLFEMKGDEPTKEELAKYLGWKISDVEEIYGLLKAREGTNADFLLTGYQTPVRDLLYSYYQDNNKLEHLEVLKAIDKLKTTNPSMIAEHLKKDREKVDKLVREILADANRHRDALELF